MIEIIPSIDIIDGKCVRLTQGRYDQKTEYQPTPMQMAQEVEAAGLKRLHVVDLDGARQGKVVNLSALQEIGNRTNLSIDFSGGIRSHADLESVYKAGAKIAMIGSVAVQNPALFRSWLKSYGGDKLMLAADVRNGEIAISGWEKPSGIKIEEHISHFADLDLKYVMCTDISKDGLLQGPAFDLYERLCARFPKIRFIASGGISSLEEIVQLSKTKLHGVIVGKALYEGKICLEQLGELSC